MQNRSIPRGILRAAVASVAAAITAGAHAAITTVPVGLPPGAPFRLVFVTDGTTTASSTDIGTYDAFVNNEAVAAGLDSYNGQPVTWQVIGSIDDEYPTSIEARDRLLVSDNVPIFRLDGQRIATNGADLWDGDIENPINVSATGALVESDSIVWTGSSSDGQVAKGLGGAPAPQGGLFSTLGDATRTDFGWVENSVSPLEIEFEGVPLTLTARLYAVSSIINPVPEPAAVGLLGAILMALGLRRR
jgi:hypothetical protein